MPGLGLAASFSLSIGSSGSPGSPGSRRDPYTTFNFLVEVEGLVVGGFSEVSGLQVETVVEEYTEGGQNDYVHKLPGPTKYPSNLVLKRGLSDVATLWSWHQEVVTRQVTRRNGTIYLLDAQGSPVLWWHFKEAYPVKWSGPDLKADSNTVAVEMLELVHRGLAKPTTSGIAGGAQGTLSASLDISLQI